jgi:hypothetical protein
LGISKVPEEVPMELARVAEALALEPEPAYARPGRDNPAIGNTRRILCATNSKLI